jgi:hypothetical protein
MSEQIDRATRLAESLIKQHQPLSRRWNLIVGPVLMPPIKGAYHPCYETIYLAEWHAMADNQDDIKNTILHEIAHALTCRVPPVEGEHGPSWFRMATELGVNTKDYAQIAEAAQ